MIGLAIDLYSLLVLAAVVLSWLPVGPTNPVRKLTEATVEPVLGRIRRYLPAIGGWDFSPLVLLFALRLLRRLLGGGL